MVTLWDTPLTGCPYVADIGEQLAIMDKTLCQSNQNIIAIEGGYGMGKTFLAKQYAAQMSLWMNLIPLVSRLKPPLPAR